jgi:sugar (pentulose or hexulose) kinase
MCGWPLNATLDAAKILYMKRRGGYADAKYFLTTADYMNFFLTGRAVIDPSSAAIRQLFRISSGDWDERMLAFIGSGRNELPEIRPTGSLVGAVTKEAATATGLAVGTPVFNGAHDQYCASVGAGVVKEGDMMLSAGTTWVVMGISGKPLFTDTFIAPGIHPATGLYGNIASLAGSGVSLEWFKTNFTQEGYDELDRQAGERLHKNGELFFYPYISGANYPLWNHKARGAFTGLELSHGRSDCALAIMEGGAFGVRGALDDFRRNGCEIKEMTIMGGAAKSGLWRSIIADCSGIPIRLNKEPDAGALGAAMIAAVGAGIYADYFEAAAMMVKPEKTQRPDAVSASAYSRKYVRYKKMWSDIERYFLLRPDGLWQPNPYPRRARFLGHVLANQNNANHARRMPR